MFLLGLAYAAFFVVTCALAMLAARSVWGHRFERPLTPFRLGLVLAIAGVGVIRGALYSQPSELLALTVTVLCLSAGWLAWSAYFKN